MELSKKGIEFIAGFEGLRTKAYDDLQPYVALTAATKIKGTLTIGIGHIGKVDGKSIKWNTTISKDKAYDLFAVDCKGRIKTLNGKLKKPVTQNMYDALFSYCYNCGFGNQHAVNCINYINKGLYEKAAQEIKNGTKTSKGIVLRGLERRRAAEYKLFIDGMAALTAPKTEAKKKCYKKYTGDSTSLVEALNAIGAKSTYARREKIAKANGIKAYEGTAAQNTKLLKLLKQGKLIKP